METKLGYLSDPLTLYFQANVIKKLTLENSQVGIILEETYFYPTGGGQEHDTGSIGDAKVVDVIKGQDGEIIHVIDRVIDTGIYEASVDKVSRELNMQHHTAQHILTHAFISVLNINTVSVKISGDVPSTIDIETSIISNNQLNKVEDCANEIVLNDHLVKSYFIPEADIKKIPFRRPPTVSGMIRVVEIDSMDYSACGGTHCPRTGMVGLIKIIKYERKDNKLRIYFVAGKQALSHFREYQTIALSSANLLNTKPEKVPETLEKQITQFKDNQEELGRLRIEMLPIEAEKLISSAEIVDGRKFVTSVFNNRPVSELKLLGMALRNSSKVISVLVSSDEKFSIVVSCSSDSQVSARDLLLKYLALINGKGGGDVSFAQGGGQLNGLKISDLLNNSKEFISSLINS